MTPSPAGDWVGTTRLTSRPASASSTPRQLRGEPTLGICHPALDQRVHEGHAGPVDEVARSDGASSTTRSARQPGAIAADVVAPQSAARPRAWPRQRPPRWSCAGRARRARCRTTSTSCSSSRGCSSWPARPWRRRRCTRRASGYGWRVEKSVAGRKVATVVLAGQRVDVGVGQVGAVVGRRAPQLDRQLHAGPGPSWLACSRRPRPAARPAVEHGPALVGVEGAPPRRRRRSSGRAARAAGSISPHDLRRRSRRSGPRTPAARRGRRGTSSRRSARRRRRGSGPRRSTGEAVARLDLDRRDAGPAGLVEPAPRPVRRSSSSVAARVAATVTRMPPAS